MELGAAATPPGPPRARRPPARAGNTSPKETQAERLAGPTWAPSTPLPPPIHPDPRGVCPSPTVTQPPHWAHERLSQWGSLDPTLPPPAPEPARAPGLYPVLWAPSFPPAPRRGKTAAPHSPRDGGVTQAGGAALWGPPGKDRAPRGCSGEGTKPRGVGEGLGWPCGCSPRPRPPPSTGLAPPHPRVSHRRHAGTCPPRAPSMLRVPPAPACFALPGGVPSATSVSPPRVPAPQRGQTRSDGAGRGTGHGCAPPTAASRPG